MSKGPRSAAPLPISRFEMRDQLERILQSRYFSKGKKKSRFIEFVSEQALLGNGDKLNEYVIGVDIYERGPGFNPQADAIVRVQAHEIRKALKDYYDAEGKGDPWRIDLPPGGYVPVFTRLSEAPPLAVTPVPRPVDWRNRALAGLIMLCAVLLVGERMTRHEANTAAKLSEGAAWFWQPFLPPAEAPLVVIPVHPLLRAVHPGDTAATWAQGHVIPKDALPEFRDTIHFQELPEFRFVANTTDFTAVGETLGLLNLFELFGKAGQKIHLQAGRLVDFESIKRGNVVLLGGNQSWSGRIFRYPEGFEFHAGVISNKAPRTGEQPV